jgi:hypothetical protein
MRCLLGAGSLGIALGCAGLGDATGAPIGVPVCDGYLESMEACIPKLTPEGQAEAQRLLDTARHAWPTAARSEEGKASLEPACTEAVNRAKKLFESKGCAF